MNALIPIRRLQIVVELMEQGQYELYAPGCKTAESAPLTRGHTPVRFYNVPDSSGAEHDIVIQVPNKHPRLEEVGAELKLMRDAQADADIKLFHSLPEADRVARIAAHRTAIREIAAMRNDLTMPAEQRQQVFARLSKSLLPAGWTPAGESAVIRGR